MHALQTAGQACTLRMRHSSPDSFPSATHAHITSAPWVMPGESPARVSAQTKPHKYEPCLHLITDVGNKHPRYCQRGLSVQGELFALSPVPGETRPNILAPYSDIAPKACVVSSSITNRIAYGPLQPRPNLGMSLRTRILQKLH